MLPPQTPPESSDLVQHLFYSGSTVRTTRVTFLKAQILTNLSNLQNFHFYQEHCIKVLQALQYYNIGLANFFAT